MMNIQTFDKALRFLSYVSSGLGACCARRFSNPPVVSIKLSTYATVNREMDILKTGGWLILHDIENLR
jgi:hypothetical protein